MYKPNRAMVLVLPLFATLMFGCSVAPTFSKPSVSISSPPNGAQVPIGQEVLIRAVANDTASIARVELWVDGNLNAVIQPTSRQAPYSAVLRWTPTSPGAHTLVVKAVNINSLTSDPATLAITVTGSSAATSTPTATVPVTLSPLIVTATRTSTVPPALPTPTSTITPQPQGNCADPNARWENVVDGQRIEALQAFIGTATSKNFAGYVVEWLRPGNVLYRSATPVVHGQLFVWNTYTVPNGIYQVALIVVLNDGTNLVPCVVTVEVSH